MQVSVRARRRDARGRGGATRTARPSERGLDDDAWKWGLQTLAVGFPSLFALQATFATGIRERGCVGRSSAGPSSRWSPAHANPRGARRRRRSHRRTPVVARDRHRRDAEIDRPRRARRSSPGSSTPTTTCRSPRCTRCGTTSTASPTATCSLDAIRGPGRRRARGRVGALPGHRRHCSSCPSRAPISTPPGLDRPVIVADYTLHQCVVSSAALDVLGIGRTTGDPPGGEITPRRRRRAHGLLVERGWSRAHAESMRDYGDPDRWAEHIAARARVLLADGITCVHDAACAARSRGGVRRHGPRRHAPDLGRRHAAPERAPRRTTTAARLDGPPTGEGDEWCRVGAMKLFADGGVSIARRRDGRRQRRCSSACASATSTSTRASRRRTRLPHRDPRDGQRRRRRHARGLRRHRPRVSPARPPVPGRARGRHEPRAVDSASRELGAVAVVQPGFVDHVGIAVSGVHFDHHHWLAFAGLADAGVTLAGSSDDPCAPVPPLWCMAHGVERRTSGGRDFEPDQSVPFDDWLVAYTRGCGVRRRPGRRARQAHTGSARRPRRPRPRRRARAASPRDLGRGRAGLRRRDRFWRQKRAVVVTAVFDAKTGSSAI